MTIKQTYCGRFAPTPSGYLHFGSLTSAVASYLDAKKNRGKWLLRIEDLDQTRSRQKMADKIISTLADYGFKWDGAIVYQSQRSELYRQALIELWQKNIIYACTCSRKDLAARCKTTAYGIVYDGKCSHNIPTNRANLFSHNKALRVKTNAVAEFKDAICGNFSLHLQQQIGDFILWRKDGFCAYHLASIVDDAAQKITHIVRGSDLLNCSFKQVFLQRQLALPTVKYAHLPLVINADGSKFSKRDNAAAIANTVTNLYFSLVFLGQNPPPELRRARLDEIWQWAIANWQLDKVLRGKYCAPPQIQLDKT